MDTKAISLSDLRADPEGVLGRCFEAGGPVVVELPNRGLVSIQPVDPADDLIDDLIAGDAGFRRMLAKSLAGGREPFRVGDYE